MSIFDTQTLPLECGKCGTKTPKTIPWFKANSEFTCQCGTLVQIDAANRDEVLRGIATLEGKIADLKGRHKWIG